MDQDGRHIVLIGQKKSKFLVAHKGKTLTFFAMDGKNRLDAVRLMLNIFWQICHGHGPDIHDGPGAWF